MMDWSTLCPVSQADLERVVTALRAVVPDMWSAVHCAQNDSFPFWAYASLNTAGPSADEVVVLSASFKWVSGAVQFSCDIAAGDGQVLAEGPGSTYAPAEGGTVDAWARSCMRKFIQLCDTHLELIAVALEDGRA